MTTRQNKKHPRSTNHNRIARAIFAAAESMGITDRQMLEELTSQVIRRLEPKPVLPGMEHLVQRSDRQSPSASQIEVTVKEILAEKAKIKVMETAMFPTKAEVKPGGLELSQNALTVLEKRYLKKDSQGKVIETPEEMFRRVARHVASAELIYDPKADVGYWEEEFYKLMASLQFLPNSPTLMNAGRELGQLSACFVIPVDDSMESIFDAVK